jgi:ABC-2 type transport system permease protein
VSIGETEDFTVFDWQAPGIFVFALLMTAIYVSATLATEYKNKTVHRLRLTKMTSFDLMAGTTIRWLFVGALQIVILFVVAYALGTQVAGEIGPTFLMCFVVSIVVVLASISLGLIISAFIEDPEQAGNIGTGIAVPLSFLTGAFFPLDFAPASILPWTHGANAMKQLMLYNAWDEAIVHLGWALIGALVLFGIGVFVYQQRRLRNL